MRFSTNQTLNITLPKVETAGKSEFHGTVTIAIDKDGSISINNQKATDQDLMGLLEQVKKLDRNMPVLIKADELTPLKRVTFVMDACRKTGLLKFSLQSR
jgi:biopolymer transport protein ExbD